jgi:hypothetical protein
LARVETGETMVISNVGILAEGWDFPACRTLILARPTRSLIRYIQMAGRVLRPHASKERALILDHSGSVIRLGFPTEEFPLELDDGTPKDAKGGQEEREKPLPKACPSCSYVKTVHKCPVCGFEPASAAQMSTSAPATWCKSRRRPRRRRWRSRSSTRSCCCVACSKNYKPGWVANKYREYFGVWPRGMEDVMAHEVSPEVSGFLKHLQIRDAKAKGGKHAGA